jgi:hypothetical protein
MPQFGLNICGAEGLETDGMQMDRPISHRPRSAIALVTLTTFAAAWSASPARASVNLDKAAIEVAFFPASIRTWTQFFQRPMTLADLRNSLRSQAPSDRTNFRLASPNGDAAKSHGTKRAPELAFDARSKNAYVLSKAGQAPAQSSGPIDVSYGLQGLEERFGVNGAVPGGDDLETSVQAKSDGPLATYPVPKAQLESMRAHAAKLGLPATASIDDTSAPAPNEVTTAHSGRHSITDASEGTAMDPLLNKSYDLNSAKTIPTLK